jgi:hypothetical protein
VRRTVLPGLVAAWIACAAPCCSSTDVTLATLPAGDDAQAPPAPRCASIFDCPAGTSYCDKTGCDSVSGTCVPFPADCDNEEKPVCGCDGITYFDHCLRQQAGIAAESPGPCPGLTCGGPSNIPCPANTFCAQLGGLGPGHCSPVAEGNCWVLPAQCPPPSQATNLWDSCEPGQHCVPTCDALRMGGSYGRSVMCP